MAKIIDDDSAQAGIESLVDQVDATGVGLLSVDDGTFFIFKTPTLENLLASARKDPQGRVLIFVKSPVATDKN